MKTSTPSAQFSTVRCRASVGAILGLAGLILLPAAAHAARVSGKLTGYESSTPEPSRELHFQNAITHDVYLSPTHPDGSFVAELPPGVYDLRAERGNILKGSIAVGEADLPLGIVNEAAPYAPARLFDLQALAPSILTSPAPSTAFIMTVDTTVPSAGATVIPKPEIDWSKRPGDETQAAAGAVAGGTATPPPANGGEGSGNNPMLAEPPLESQRPGLRGPNPE